jgi:hypothetical protein
VASVDELSWLHRNSNGKLIRDDFAGTELGYHSNEISPCECLALDYRRSVMDSYCDGVRRTNGSRIKAAGLLVKIVL